MALRSNSLGAGDDCTFEKPEAAVENDHLGGGVDRNCSPNILLIWVEAMSESFFESSRMATTSCGGQVSSTGTARQTRWWRALARCFMALRSNSLVAGDDGTFEKPEAAFENDHLWLAVSIATVQQTLR